MTELATSHRDLTGPFERPDVLTTMIVVSVLAAGLWLRLDGIRFGLPAVYNPDEVAIMSRALSFAKGDLNPHNFVYPTFFFYALAGWIAGYFGLGLATGAFASIAAFEQQFFRDPSGVYLAGRLLGALCGTLTIFVTFVFGSRHFGRIAGMSAAAFIAVAPYAVRDAHYVKHDIPATLVVLLGMIAIFRVWPGSSQKGIRLTDVIVAGALCGVASSIHYYAVFACLPLVLAAWTRARATGSAPVESVLVACAAAAAAATTFFLLSPYIVIDWQTAWRDMNANRRIVVDRAVASTGGAFGSLPDYLAMLSRDAMGWPVVLLAIAGFLVISRRSNRTLVLFAVFPISFLLFLGITVPAGRYLNPVLPLIAVSAGVAVSSLSALAGVRARGILAALLTVAAAQPAIRLSVRTVELFNETDTRTLAQRYIETRIPEGSTVLIQPYSVSLRPSRASLEEALRTNLPRDRRIPTKVSLQLALEPYPEPSYRLLYLGDGGLDTDKIYVRYGELGGDRRLDRLHELGVGVIVITRYRMPQPMTLPFLRALDAEGRHLATFSPFRFDAPAGSRLQMDPYLHNTNARPDPALERPGPQTEIWQID